MKDRKKQILWYAFLLTLFIQLMGGVLYFIVLRDPKVVQLFYSLTKLVMLLAPILLFRFSFQLPRFSLTKNTAQSLFFGLLSGVLIALLVYAVFVAFQSEFNIFADNISQKVEDFGIVQYYLLAAVGMSLVHSLFEEYFWRWYVVGGLETRLSSGSAMMLGALLFSLHHFVILSQFFPAGLTLLFGMFVGFGGVIWSLIYKKTNSLLGPWLSHACVDGVLFYIGWVLIHS